MSTQITFDIRNAHTNIDRNNSHWKSILKQRKQLYNISIERSSMHFMLVLSLFQTSDFAEFCANCCRSKVIPWVNRPVRKQINYFKFFNMEEFIHYKTGCSLETCKVLQKFQHTSRIKKCLERKCTKLSFLRAYPLMGK